MTRADARAIRYAPRPPMNYRHHYPAGGPADLLKHLVLVMLVRRLQAKPGAMFYLDTHAGAGSYDLAHEMSQKTGEYLRGAARLWGPVDQPGALGDLLRVLEGCNPDGVLRVYPGSPRIVRALMRPQDRMVCCELTGRDSERLHAEFRHDAQVSVHMRDGYEGLRAFLPPAERRGLVLIDPPFERPDEFAVMLAGLKAAHARWPTGCYALWYPIKSAAAVGKLHAALMQSQIRKILIAELYTRLDHADDELMGSGMILVNPPYQSDQSLRGVLPVLAARIAGPERATGAVVGHTRVEWLVGE